MSGFPENVRQVLIKLVPASVINDIECFVFYDNHPRDEKNIDVTVCTRKGEVKEFYQRDLVSSLKLDGAIKPLEIKILRNSNCELYYIVATKDSMTVLSRRDKLQIHKNVTNIDRYDISDTTCSGQASLRIFCKGDAVPLVLDDNLENFITPDLSGTYTAPDGSPLSPIMLHLARKLSEARYSVKCNEKMYKEFVDLRQAVAFSNYKKIHPNLHDAVFKDGKELASALKINMKTPWTKVCNKKLVVAVNVENLSSDTLEDVHVLLDANFDTSVEYTTKLFVQSNSSPLWEELQTQTILNEAKTAIIVVMDLDELKSNVVSKIELNAVVYCKKMGEEYLLPIDIVKLSSLDTMAEEFDVLSSEAVDTNCMLAILASTEKTDLILRHIKRNSEEKLTIDLFCEYLHMDKVPNSNNIAVYRKSPYHTLNGTMIILNDDIVKGTSLSVTVYSRTPSQVLSLIHYIHDAVPYSIVITTSNHTMTAKDDSLSKYNEDMLADTQPQYLHQNYATSMLTRTDLVHKYLDNCLIKMGESKNPVVQSKIGSEIDLFAGGETSYIEFKNKMRAEANKVVQSSNVVQTVELSDEMCTD